MVNNIKVLRLRAGLTQKELAEKISVAQGKVSRYESLKDLSNITLGTMCDIAQALDCTVNDLIYALPERSHEDNVLDMIFEQYANDKTAAEQGDVDAIINNRFI